MGFGAAQTVDDRIEFFRFAVSALATFLHRAAISRSWRKEVTWEGCSPFAEARI